MQLKTIHYSIICLLWPLITFSQSGIRLNTEHAMNGYVLAGDFDNTYLIDNCGIIINEWATGFVDKHTKLLPNGNLLFIRYNTIVEMSWDGTTVVSIESPMEKLLTYEVIKMPSNNYLCVARKRLDNFASIGYDLSVSNPTLIDMLVEFDPDGNIVWEWDISDHIIHERESFLPNYGSIKNNPQLLNMDVVSAIDWGAESFMINGIDYNEALDLIAISVRKMSEVVIIDHSTTTAEAASGRGGFHGKGGDILYRWGNPQNYERGTEEDRRLWFQHSPNWIEYGEHKGKMIIFNNGFERFSNFDSIYSSVPIIELPLDQDGKFILEENQAFGPQEIAIEYDKHQSNTEFYSAFTSSAKVLDNGNIFVTVGGTSRLIELDPKGKIVWEYLYPNFSGIFRTVKYPFDYPAFLDKDMEPTGRTIEMPSSTYNCDLAVATEELFDPYIASSLKVEYSTSGVLLKNTHHQDVYFTMINTKGQVVSKDKTNNYLAELNYSDYNSGLYFVNIFDLKNHWVETIKIVIP